MFTNYYSIISSYSYSLIKFFIADLMVPEIPSVCKTTGFPLKFVMVGIIAITESISSLLQRNIPFILYSLIPLGESLSVLQSP